MGELVAILSGKGGTGKTSVCAGISIALAAGGKKVLCIDCDVGLRNLDISLGLTDCAPLSFLDVTEGGYHLNQATQHPLFPSLYFLTAPMNRSAEQIELLAFSEMLQKARREFDYILLDAPAGVDAGFRLAAVPADRCILVTGAGPAAVRDAARVGEILELMEKKDVRLIVNRVDREMFAYLQLTVDDIMDTAGLPLLGIVPEDPNVIFAAACARPVAKFKKRTSAVKAYQRIANRIQGLPEPITLR